MCLSVFVAPLRSNGRKHPPEHIGYICGLFFRKTLDLLVEFGPDNPLFLGGFPDGIVKFLQPFLNLGQALHLGAFRFPWDCWYWICILAVALLVID